MGDYARHLCPYCLFPTAVIKRLRLDERLETEMFAEVEMRGRHEKMTLHGVTL